MRKTNWIFFAVFVVIAAVLFWFSHGTTATINADTYKPSLYASAASLLPPVIAIGLALITKEVYSSLFTGIGLGALLYANGNIELALNTLLFQKDGGLIAKVGSASNMGILIFLVILGILVALMHRVGSSAAFGQWASRVITTRKGSIFSTICCGVLIFIDDYFNCLSVGSVMRPVTDLHKVSRAKLAYLIDSTAAPICIIAPVSSWAAAVTSSVPEGSGINGFSMFISAIPYNFYAILTIFMMVVLTTMKFDYGPMRKHEDNALKGDLFTTNARLYGEAEDEPTEPKGSVFDLVCPVSVLIVCCIIGMIYTGGYFTGASFVDAFADADASKGLVLGSVATLFIVFILFMTRGVMTFSEFCDCIPRGFRAMVAPILILCMAWTLSGLTGLLGAKFYVSGLVQGSLSGLEMFIPAFIFAVAAFLAFSTGTSWGTFTILIPLVCQVFGDASLAQMLTISIAATLSGAVCGDHCSPISDTTIMASAGAHCDHVAHVSTQLPYAMTVAAVSIVGYLVAGFLCCHVSTSTAIVSLPVAALLLCLVLVIIRGKVGKLQY